MNSVGRLLSRHLQDLAPGRLEWIGLRVERKMPMRLVDQCEVVQGFGLQGDRRCQGREDSARQVTLINQEHLEVIAKLLNIDDINPELLRRNLVVSGINLMALRYQKFRIGEVIFEATALCHPCARMEQALGKGALAAMLGHGGICAKIISDGVIHVGDLVEKIEQ